MLDRWELVEADLHDRYGIDTSGPIMHRRSWRWLRARIFGLLNMPPMIVAPAGEGPPLIVWPTRIAYALHPPA